MKISRIFFAFILLCFLIPVAASPLTFDQYGIPKLALFGIFIAISLSIIITNRHMLIALPMSVKVTLGIFFVVQCFQTFRLQNPVGGFFGEYGQSESLLVQLGFVLIFLTSYLLFSSGNPFRPFRTAILAAVHIICGYGILEYFMADPLTHLPVLRVKSLLGDPNSLGVWLILAIPILFWDIVSEKHDAFPSRFRFYLSAFGIFLGVTNLVLTFSRASWLGFLITVLIFMSFLIRKQSNHYLLRLFCIIIVIAIFCGQGFTRLQPKSHADYDLNARIASVKEGKDSGRKFLWSTAWTVFKTSPFIGYGMGTFQDTFHRYETKEAVNNWSPERDLREVHNETLHYLATQGLVGLLAYFGLLFTFGYTVWRRRSRCETDAGRTALISALAGYLIFIQFAYPLLHYTFLFWVYWGILLSSPPSEQNLPVIKKPSIAMIVLIGLIIGGSFGFGYWIYRADALYLKAFSAGHEYRYHQALSYFPEIISQNPWIYQYRYRYAVTLIRAARQAERKSQLNSSLQYLTQAQSILETLQRSYPARFQISFLLGEIWESRHHYSKADIYYRRAASLFPANFKLWYRIAKIDLLLGRKQKARSAWRTGMNLSPSYMIFSSNRDNLKEFGRQESEVRIQKKKW